MRNKAIGFIAIFSACISVQVLFAQDLFAQAISATISGVIKDQSDAVLPGVTITVTNIDTGISHTVVTGDTGSYKVPGLAPGNYKIQAALAGFKTEIRTGITLAVNQEAVINLTLQVGEISEQITVAEQAPLIESTNATLSGLVDEKKIRDLPLNGRDFFQLTYLQPGVRPSMNAGPNPFARGKITKAAVNGMRPTFNNVTVDGTDVNDPTYNVPTGGAAGAALGVEAIREFRILTNNYSAEYGRNAGSIVNAVTKSGTNDLHFSVFEFHRNSALDARNFFDPPRDLARSRGLAEIPPFKRNQFGFTASGPIIRNKTFFFGNYEGLRERLGVTAVATVPTAAARQGILPRGRIEVAPQVRPYLNLWPLPNGRDFGDGTAQWTGSATQPTNEDYFVVRIDHNISEKDMLFVRYTFDGSSSIAPFIATLVPGFPAKFDHRHQFITIQEQKTFRPNLLNEFRFGFNRTRYVADNLPSIPTELSISLVPGKTALGPITIPGISTIGGSLLFPLGSFANTFQFIDNLSYIKKRHSFKFGAEVRRLQMNGFFDVVSVGNYNFLSLEEFLRADPFIYAGVTPGFTNSARGYRQTQLNLFAQDDIKVTPNLTVNIGLRYEYNSSPSEQSGRLVNIRNPLADLDIVVGEELYEAHKDLFQPRFGFAWTPFGNQGTVIRGGFGIFHDQIWMNLYSNTRWSPPFYQRLTLVRQPGQPLAFPDPLEGRATPGLLPFSLLAFTAVNPEIDQPYAMHYNLQLQQQILSDLVLKIGYVGSRGNHLIIQGAANTRAPIGVLENGRRIYPATGPRINRNFGPISQFNSWAKSFFNSLQVGMEKRFSQGLQFQASYTFARSIDDASGPFPTDWVTEPTTPQNMFNLRAGNRALSGFHVKHNFVINYTYDLPFGPGRRFGANLTGFVRKLAEGWQINGITSFISGHPFTVLVGLDRNQDLLTVDRPNLRPGAKERILGQVERWFDPTVYELQPAGVDGNLGRNTLLSPGFNNFDFAVVKNITFMEDKTLQFRAEFFNIFNHPNFAAPNNTRDPTGSGGAGDVIIRTPDGQIVGNAGQIFSTLNTSRQLQFGLKIIF